MQQLYSRLSELLGLHDHLVLLNVIVGKIATNLKCYTEVIDTHLIISFTFLSMWGGFKLHLFHEYRMRKLLSTHWTCFLNWRLGQFWLFWLFMVSISFTFYLSFFSFLLQLHDWKATSQIRHCKIYNRTSHSNSLRSCLGYFTSLLFFWPSFKWRLYFSSFILERALPFFGGV